VRIRNGEANLVVHNDVNGATRVEAACLRELHGLHDHALPCERSVAVHEHRHHTLTLCVAATLLTGAHGAFDTGFTTSRCDGLKASTTCTLPEGVRRSAEKPL